MCGRQVVLRYVAVRSDTVWFSRQVRYVMFSRVDVGCVESMAGGLS